MERLGLELRRLLRIEQHALDRGQALHGHASGDEVGDSAFLEYLGQLPVDRVAGIGPEREPLGAIEHLRRAEPQMLHALPGDRRIDPGLP